MGRNKLTDEEKQASIERRRARQREYWHKTHPASRSYKDDQPKDHTLYNYIQRRLKDGDKKTVLEITREYYGYTNNDK